MQLNILTLLLAITAFVFAAPLNSNGGCFPPDNECFQQVTAKSKPQGCAPPDVGCSDAPFADNVDVIEEVSALKPDGGQFPPCQRDPMLCE
jgi:hypothetical protein